MRRTFIPVMALSLAVAPLALEAQTTRPERGQAGVGPRGGMGMHAAVTANPAGRVLQHRAALGLSLDQIRQLQQLQAQIDTRNQPLRDQLRAARPAVDRAEVRERGAALTAEQREQRRAQMEEMRTRMQNATPEQRAQMREQMREQMQADMRERFGPGTAPRGRAADPEMRQRMEALRPVMEQLQQSNQQARNEVQAVLTAEQHAKLLEMNAERSAEMRQRMQGDRQRPAMPGRRGPRGPRG
jgi:Spy/CpxP family protein refolding chaperone